MRWGPGANGYGVWEGAPGEAQSPREGAGGKSGGPGRQATGRLDGWEQRPLEGASGKVRAGTPALGRGPEELGAGTEHTRSAASSPLRRRWAYQGARSGAAATWGGGAGPPGGEDRSLIRRSGSQGLGGHGPLRRAGGRPAGPRGQEQQQRPRRRRSPAPLPPALGTWALGAAPRPATAAGAAGLGKEEAARAGQAPREPGRHGEGPARAEERWRFQKRAVPEPRSLRPAPRWAGTAEPPPRSALGPQHLRVAASAPPPPTPLSHLTWLRHRRNTEEGLWPRLYRTAPQWGGCLPAAGVAALAGGARCELLGSSLDTQLCAHTCICTYTCI